MQIAIDLNQTCLAATTKCSKMTKVIINSYLLDFVPKSVVEKNNFRKGINYNKNDNNPNKKTNLINYNNLESSKFKYSAQLLKDQYR